MNWIKAEDRMPKADGAYLCVYWNNDVFVGYRFPSLGEDKFKSLETDRVRKVSHWMPLPDPPSQKEELEKMKERLNYE